MSTKILAFAGSTREDSFNKKLVRYAVSIVDPQQAEVTLIDLRDYTMPLYDGDLEAASGIPEQAMQFRKLLKQHQGFLLSCPEYNSSISGVLKNAIDWASRPIPDEPSLVCFKGKIAALLSASPGRLGGLRGLVTVRSILSNIGTLVLPDQFALGTAHEAFDEQGNVRDAAQQQAITTVVKQLVKLVDRL